MSASFTTWCSVRTQSSVPLVALEWLFEQAFGMLLRCRLLPPSVPGNAKISVDSFKAGILIWVLLYCYRWCCVSFPFPPVVQPLQLFGWQWCLYSSPLPSLARHRWTCLCWAGSTSRLSRAAKSQGCEGRDASLQDEAELRGCCRTQWLGFHHACDELCVAV